MDPRSIDTFGGSFPAVLSLESCDFDVEKCGCFEGPNKVVHFSGKVLDLIIGRSIGCGCGFHPSPIGVISGALEATLGPAGVIAGDVEVASASVGMTVSDIEAALDLVGMFAGVVGAALGATPPSWLAGVKQNSSEAKPLSCEHLVGVTRFELVTSSVSGKRSPPELNARSRVRECAGNNITELPPSGKSYFLKSCDLRPHQSPMQREQHAKSRVCTPDELRIRVE